MTIKLPEPSLQVDFAAALLQIRGTFLQDALLKAVKDLPLRRVDQELSGHAPENDLSLLASKGLRGELVFAVPTLLKREPRLLGYYRLLLGYSQKAFYQKETGVGGFKSMEEKGLLSDNCASRLPVLCRAINEAASHLLAGLAESSLNKSFLDDLTLITLGPQLRGGANVKKGALGIVQVFDLIRGIVEDKIVSENPRLIEVRNSAGRRVLIEFAPDPDIIIRELMTAGSENYRNVIAIEVKAGTDFSNVHNRMGEAEKSHQKAKAAGYTECWTVVNVDKMNEEVGKRASPSTNRFYRLSKIVGAKGSEYEDFRNRMESLTGIPTKHFPRRKKIVRPKSSK